MKKTAKNLIIILTLFLLPINFVEAVALRLEPSYSKQRINDSFLVTVKMDAEGECVNTVGIKLRFPQQILDGKSFNKGGSVLDLWPEEPTIENNTGLVSFAGGIPGGYCKEGFIKLGEIEFKLTETPGKIAERITISDAEIFLDDGEGTVLKDVPKEHAYFMSIPEKAIDPTNPWKEKMKNDSKPPKEFTPRVIADQSINNGEYSLVFSTRDEETGIDHYLIAERKRIGFIEIGLGKWKKAESPHLLEDQKLNSVVRIKAVDRAGNERVEKIEPPYGVWDYGPWIGVVVILLILIYLNQKKKNEELEIDWS